MSISCPEYLIKSAQQGLIQDLRDGIEKYKFSSSSTDSDGCSLLHWAAINNQLQAVSYLIDSGAEVNLKGGILGETPLLWGIRSGSILIVDLLTKKGADLNLKSSEGLDALRLATRLDHQNIVFLLLHLGADPNAHDSNNENAFIWILKNRPSSTDLIKLFLKYGVSVDLTDENNENALHLATRKSRRRNTELNFFLLHKIYRADGAFNALKTKNKFGLTPYEVAEKEIRNVASIRFYWDAWMFANLPYSFPMFVSLLNALLFTSLVSTYKMYGILYWLFSSAILSTQLSQPTIESADSRSICGTSIGLFFSFIYTYYVYIFNHMSPPLNIIIKILFALTSLTMTLLILIKPTASNRLISEGISFVEELLSSSQSSSSLNICPECLTDKSSSSFHCSRCNKCYLNLDHHCSPIMNCIGKGNRRLFAFFGVFGSLSCFMYSYSSLYVQYKMHCPLSKGILWGFFSVQYCMLSSGPIILTLVTWAALILAFVFINIVSMQLYFVAIETTTSEIIYSQHDGKCRQDIATSSKNILNFITTGEYKVVSHPVVFEDYSHHQNSSSHSHKNCCNIKKIEPTYADVGNSFIIDATERL